MLKKVILSAVAIAALGSSCLSADSYVKLGVGSLGIDGINGVDTDNATSYEIGFGAQKDYGDFVVGGEFMFQAATFEDDIGSDDTDTYAYDISVKVGYQPVDVLTLYGTLGYGERSVSENNYDTTDSGLVYSAGADYFLTDWMSFGAEYKVYTYSDSEDIEFNNVNANIKLRW